MKNQKLLKALKRKGIQTAIIIDAPGLLRGDDYELSFQSNLIDGEWKTTETRWTTRRYRNGNFPNEIWSISRDKILHFRMNKNMFCSPGDDTYSDCLRGENLSDIRQVGELAFRSMLGQIPLIHKHDEAFIRRNAEYRERKGWA